MRCFIAGAGEFCGRALPTADDYVIAADAGYAALFERGIAADAVVGDFDSLGQPPDHPNVKQSPVEKDETDVMLAVEEGFALGCDTFIIDGGLGARLPHTLANIQILANITARGARGYLIGKDVVVTAVMNGSILFDSKMRGSISVFCMGGKAEGVTITGLKYPLNNAMLTFDNPLGVSNEFMGVPATITVRSGMLAIMSDDMEIET